MTSVLGVKVSNTPGAVDDATATTALYLIISTLRRFSQVERDLRKGAWKSSLDSGRAFDLTGKTLAILGMGGIGTRIAELVHAFPMRVIYHNRRPAEGGPSWAEYYPKEKFAEFLKEADVLVVSVPLKPETEGLVGKAMIRGLKKGAIIINTARGKVIDEDAMISALEDGHVSCLTTVHVRANLPRL
jgi:glyoxylate reductase